jgi:pimeloyl-ACP methyl ester carboxylesterase
MLKGVLESNNSTVNRGAQMLQHLIRTSIFSSSLLLLAFFSANLSAATISGVVVNESNQPLQGAIVHYKKSNLRDTTDSQGRYSITVPTVSVANPMHSFELNLQGKTHTRLYSMGGRLLTQANGQNINGFITQSLKNLPLGAYLVQVGNLFQKVLNYPGLNPRLSMNNGLAEIQLTTAKSAAVAADDSLYFVALGKTPVTVMLQPNQTQVPNVTLRGTVTTYRGYTEYDFTVAGRAAKCVIPKTVLPQKPWIWECRFWDHWPAVDTTLLRLGYYLVYLDIVETYGSPTSIGWYNEYYDLLTNYFSFNKKCVLEGMSRGGFTTFNWAGQRPNAVQAMYEDAPVMDFKIWPGYDEVKGPFGFTSEAEYQAYKGNPVDQLQTLGAAKVPIFWVVGDADGLYSSVMSAYNKYVATGAPTTIVVKPGVGHTHGLPSPTPIVTFIQQYLPAN